MTLPGRKDPPLDPAESARAGSDAALRSSQSAEATPATDSQEPAAPGSDPVEWNGGAAENAGAARVADTGIESGPAAFDGADGVEWGGGQRPEDIDGPGEGGQALL